MKKLWWLAWIPLIIAGSAGFLSASPPYSLRVNVEPDLISPGVQVNVTCIVLGKFRPLDIFLVFPNSSESILISHRVGRGIVTHSDLVVENVELGEGVIRFAINTTNLEIGTYRVVSRSGGVEASENFTVDVLELQANFSFVRGGQVVNITVKSALSGSPLQADVKLAVLEENESYYGVTDEAGFLSFRLELPPGNHTLIVEASRGWLTGSVNLTMVVPEQELVVWSDREFYSPDNEVRLYVEWEGEVPPSVTVYPPEGSGAPPINLSPELLEPGVWVAEFTPRQPTPLGVYYAVARVEGFESQTTFVVTSLALDIEAECSPSICVMSLNASDAVTEEPVSGEARALVRGPDGAEKNLSAEMEAGVCSLSFEPWLPGEYLTEIELVDARGISALASITLDVPPAEFNLSASLDRLAYSPGEMVNISIQSSVPLEEIEVLVTRPDGVCIGVPVEAWGETEFVARYPLNQSIELGEYSVQVSAAYHNFTARTSAKFFVDILEIDLLIPEDLRESEPFDVAIQVSGFALGPLDGAEVEVVVPELDASLQAVSDEGVANVSLTLPRGQYTLMVWALWNGISAETSAKLEVLPAERVTPTPNVLNLSLTSDKPAYSPRDLVLLTASSNVTLDNLTALLTLPSGVTLPLAFEQANDTLWIARYQLNESSELGFYRAVAEARAGNVSVEVEAEFLVDVVKLDLAVPEALLGYRSFEVSISTVSSVLGPVDEAKIRLEIPEANLTLEATSKNGTALFNLTLAPGNYSLHVTASWMGLNTTRSLQISVNPPSLFVEGETLAKAMKVVKVLEAIDTLSGQRVVALWVNATRSSPAADLLADPRLRQVKRVLMDGNPLRGIETVQPGLHVLELWLPEEARLAKPEVTYSEVPTIFGRRIVISLSEKLEGVWLRLFTNLKPGEKVISIERADGKLIYQYDDTGVVGEAILTDEWVAFYDDPGTTYYVDVATPAPWALTIFRESISSPPFNNHRYVLHIPKGLSEFNLSLYDGDEVQVNVYMPNGTLYGSYVTSSNESWDSFIIQTYDVPGIWSFELVEDTWPSDNGNYYGFMIPELMTVLNNQSYIINGDVFFGTWDSAIIGDTSLGLPPEWEWYVIVPRGTSSFSLAIYDGDTYYLWGIIALPTMRISIYRPDGTLYWSGRPYLSNESWDLGTVTLDPNVEYGVWKIVLSEVFFGYDDYPTGGNMYRFAVNLSTGVWLGYPNPNLSIAEFNVPETCMPPGTTFNVSVVVNNSGFVGLRDVQVALEIPAGWTVDQPVKTISGWLWPNSTAVVEFQVTIPADAAPGNYTLTVNASHPWVVPGADDEERKNVTVCLINVGVRKSIRPGDPCTYNVNLLVSNYEPLPTPEINVYDIIPSGMALTDSNPPPSGNSGNVYWWSLVLGPAGSPSSTYRISYNLTASACGASDYNLSDAFVVGVDPPEGYLNVSATEFMELILYPNGTNRVLSFWGFLTVSNPTSDVVSDISVELDGEGYIFYLDYPNPSDSPVEPPLAWPELRPGDYVRWRYVADPALAEIPLRAFEALSYEQQACGTPTNITLEITLVVDQNLSEITLIKPIPDWLEVLSVSSDAGSVSVTNGYLNWTIGETQAPSELHLMLRGEATVGEGTRLPSASLVFKRDGASVLDRISSVTAVGPAAVEVEKNATAGWSVKASFTNLASDLTYNLTGVCVWEGAPPPAGRLVFCETPNVLMQPGDVWTSDWRLDPDAGAVPKYYASANLTVVPHIGGSLVPLRELLRGGYEISATLEELEINCTPAAPVGEAVLDFSKSVTLPVAEVGDVVSFTIVVRNVGDAPSGVIQIFDRLPAELAIVEGTSSVNGTLVEPAVIDGTLSWVLPPLTPGSRWVISFSAQVTAFPEEGLARNVVVYEGEEVAWAVLRVLSPPAPPPTPPTPTPAVTVPSLSLEKSCSPSTVAIGTTVSCTIRLANSGNGTAENLTVVDLLPEELEYVEGSAVPELESYSEGRLTWRVNELPPGEEFVASFLAVVTGGSPGEALINLAYARNLTATFRLTVIAPPTAPTISKVGEYLGNQTISYLVSVFSPEDITNLSVIDYAPESAEILEGSLRVAGVEGWEFYVSDQTLRLLLRGLRGGAPATITFRVTVPLGIAGDIVNIAELPEYGQRASSLVRIPATLITAALGGVSILPALVMLALFERGFLRRGAILLDLESIRSAALSGNLDFVTGGRRKMLITYETAVESLKDALLGPVVSGLIERGVLDIVATDERHAVSALLLSRLTGMGPRTALDIIAAVTSGAVEVALSDPRGDSIARGLGLDVIPIPPVSTAAGGEVT